MNKILIIEDSLSMLKAYKRYVAIFREDSNCDGIFLETLDDAEFYLQDKLPDQTDIVGIIFDGSMNSANFAFNTRHLVRLAKEAGFQGFMIANSGEPSYNKALMEEGCTHTSPSKGEAIGQLFDLLKP